MNQETGKEAIQIAKRVALDHAIANMSDEYNRQARKYAEQLIQTALDKTQVHGLETLAFTTNKVSDVTDWLKLRVGRDEKRNRWAKDGIGRDLLTALEGLREDAHHIVTKIIKDYPSTVEDPDLERQVHLRLIREYLKHLRAHFEYALAEKRWRI